MEAGLYVGDANVPERKQAIICLCFSRYPDLTERDVSPVDYVWKTFEVAHIYNIRGLYSITINGFDERSYAEESHHITVFKMPCKVPKVKVELRGLSTVIPAMVQRLRFSINVQHLSHHKFGFPDFSG